MGITLIKLWLFTLEIKDSGLKVLCACIACLDDHFESISMITVWEES